MSVSNQQLFKNTSVLMISQVISWVLTFALTLYLPRYFGVANIGKYQLAVSLWMIVSIFASFGMDTYLTREIAHDRSRTDALLSQVIVLKIIFFLIGVGGMLAYASIVQFPADTFQMILVLGFTNFISLFSSALSAVIQGMERIEFLATIGVLTNLFITVLSITMIVLHMPIILIVAVGSLGQVFSLGAYLRVFSRLHQFRFQFSFQGAKSLLFICLSFFLLQVFITLYNQVDIVVISWFTSEEGIGWYGVAARLTGTLMFIPTVFMTVFFPTFSRLHHQSPEELTKLFRKAFNLMFLLGVAVGGGIFVIAGPIVRLIYGPEFANSAPILSLRGIVSIFTFVNILLGMYLVSINKQTPWIAVIAVATIATIPLDIVFIPYCERMYANGALGGIFSFLVTETFETLIGLLLLPKGTLTWGSFGYALRALAAGACMVLAIWWLKGIFILIPVALGGVIFITLAYLFKLITREEWLLFRGVLSSIAGRFRKRIVNRMNEA